MENLIKDPEAGKELFVDVYFYGLFAEFKDLLKNYEGICFAVGDNPLGGDISKLITKYKDAIKSYEGVWFATGDNCDTYNVLHNVRYIKAPFIAGVEEGVCPKKGDKVSHVFVANVGSPKKGQKVFIRARTMNDPPPPYLFPDMGCLLFAEIIEESVSGQNTQSRLETIGSF